MDLIKIGAQLLQSQLGSNLQTDDIASALSGLFSGDNLDLASLVTKMQSNDGLAGMVASWLGDGDNTVMSGNQVMDIFCLLYTSDAADELT